MEDHDHVCTDDCLEFEQLTPVVLVPVNEADDEW